MGKAKSSILFKQYLSLQVVNREFTGVGILDEFPIPAGTVKLSGSPSFWFGDVHAKTMVLNTGAGF